MFLLLAFVSFKVSHFLLFPRGGGGGGGGGGGAVGVLSLPYWKRKYSFFFVH